jgi:hypothetical protein
MINYYKLFELERIRYCDLFLNAPTAPNVLKHTNGKCANPNFEKKEIDYSKKEPPPLSPTTQHYRTQKGNERCKKTNQGNASGNRPLQDSNLQPLDVLSCRNEKSKSSALPLRQVALEGFNELIENTRVICNIILAYERPGGLIGRVADPVMQCDRRCGPKTPHPQRIRFKISDFLASPNLAAPCHPHTSPPALQDAHPTPPTVHPVPL